MADLICAELTKFADQQGVEIFFSAHGVPKSYVDEGERGARARWSGLEGAARSA